MELRNALYSQVANGLPQEKKAKSSLPYMFESPGDFDPDRIETEEEMDIGIMMLEGLIK